MRVMARRALALAGLAAAAAGAAALWGRSRQVAVAEPGPAIPQRNGAGPTRAELYRRAQELDIEGRSKMTKAQLADAVRGRGEQGGNA